MGHRIFYMVWVEGKDKPFVRHATLNDAEKEAERLASIERMRVYILKAVSTCKTIDIEWSRCS